MLALAATWRVNTTPVPTAEIIGDPVMARYVTGWPRPNDAGFIASDDDGHPVGAAWYRLFSASEPGFGFVSPTTPEVSIAVIPARRGTGIGGVLLQHLIELAWARGVQQLSLSVERDNPARHLYARMGFTPVGEGTTAITMVLSRTDG